MRGVASYFCLIINFLFIDDSSSNSDDDKHPPKRVKYGKR